MVGSLRDKINEAPPWVSYSIAGGGLVILIVVIVWTMSSSSGPGELATDKHIYFRDTQTGMTVSAEKAREMLREASKANPGQRALIKNPETGEHTGVIGMKCAECGAYFEMPEKTGSILPTDWRDECPDCGYSAQRERSVKAVLEQKKKGTYDETKVPPFIREAVEDWEAEHGSGG